MPELYISRQASSTPLFSLPEGLEAGLSYQQMRARSYERPGRSLRLLKGSEPTLLDRVAPLTRLSERTAASHATAARLWGIPVPPWAQTQDVIHLSRPMRMAQTRRPGVQGHNGPLLRGDVIDLQGVKVTAPAWTWVDLAEQLSLEDLVAAGDSLLRRPDAPFRGGELLAPDPLCHLEDLEEVLTRRRGTRGIRRAREALPLLRSGVDSAQESKLRLLIHFAGLPEPTVNEWILDSFGRRVSRPDLQYRESKVAIEYEGDHHRTDPKQWARDIERDDRLRAMGWTVLRFTKHHLRPESVDSTIRKIRRAIASSQQK